MNDLAFTVFRFGNLDKTINIRPYHVQDRNQVWFTISARLVDNYGLARIANTPIKYTYDYMRNAVSL